MAAVSRLIGRGPVGRECVELGAGEVLLTSRTRRDKDGFDVELTRAVSTL